MTFGPHQQPWQRICRCEKRGGEAWQIWLEACSGVVPALKIHQETFNDFK